MKDPPGLGCMKQGKKHMLDMVNLTLSYTHFDYLADLDATGKVASGVLAGATAWLGQYNQCMGLPKARYCLLDMAAVPLEQADKVC